MVEQSVKDRVYAAAERIAAERNPTVATVREAAAVSNGDATRYLREWREERVAAGSMIAALPQQLTEQALRLAGAMWAEAATTAAGQHAALEGAWRDEKAHQEEEIAELVRDLDEANRIAADTAAQHETALQAAVSAASEHQAAAVAAVTELTTARAAHLEETTTLARQLAETRATVSTLQDTQAALIARIPNYTQGRKQSQ